MFDFETAVSGIEFKVRQLADEVTRLRKTVEGQSNRIVELEKALEEKEKTVNKLTEENKIIKLGNRLSDGDDSTELKLKITQMIRVIDKSLDILKTT